MSSIASDPCDYDTVTRIVVMEAMNMTMMGIMNAIMIAMIKKQMEMRATISEEKLRKMVIIALMMKRERTKSVTTREHPLVVTGVLDLEEV